MGIDPPKVQSAANDLPVDLAAAMTDHFACEVCGKLHTRRDCFGLPCRFCSRACQREYLRRGLELAFKRGQYRKQAYENMEDGTVQLKPHGRGYIRT